MTSLKMKKTYDDSSDEEDEEEKAILSSGPTFGCQAVKTPAKKSTTTKASSKNTPTVTQDEEDEIDEGSPDKGSLTQAELQRKGKVSTRKSMLSLLQIEE